VPALRDASLLGLFVPKVLGGAEPSPPHGLEIVEILSRADSSTGWVVMATEVAMASCGAFLLPDAAKAVFKTHVPLIAGQGAPIGRADAEPKGYRLNGNWSYASGLLHSKAIPPLIKGVGGTILWAGDVEGAAYGNLNAKHWEFVVLVRYPSRKAFLKMVTSAEMHRPTFTAKTAWTIT
jgi:indole-3-acetate monooxygenase